MEIKPMKRKTGNVIFVAACMAIGLIPFACMAVAKTETTTENRVLSEWPALIEDGSLNVNFLPEAGNYFEDHFAFRNQIVAADSLVMGKIFHQSAVDTVLVGTDGWLYYTDSLDDYLGQNVVSDRGAYNIANNLKIVQNKMAQLGIDFAFTIAPNKNSLYDEHMPYYYRIKASDVNNRQKVIPLLEQLSVKYIDLYTPFEQSDEVLYRAQDSHWNEKGAVLAYNTILDDLGKEHNDFSDVQVSRTKTEKGDLGVSLYSVAAETEWDYRYEYDSQFTYVTDTESWEDVWIQTESDGKSGSLLMFRDSFGNTLSPLIAEEYGQAAFSRDTVYHLDSRIDACQPDVVIFEIVERNLERFGQFARTDNSSGPPIMEAPYAGEADIYSAVTVENGATAEAFLSDQRPDYLCITGQIDEELLDTETNVYLEITSDGTSNVYEAYTVTDPETGDDNGYLMYLNTERIPEGVFQIRVFTENAEGDMSMVLDQEIDVSGEISG